MYEIKYILNLYIIGMCMQLDLCSSKELSYPSQGGGFTDAGSSISTKVYTLQWLPSYVTIPSARENVVTSEGWCLTRGMFIIMVLTCTDSAKVGWLHNGGDGACLSDGLDRGGWDHYIYQVASGTWSSCRYLPGLVQLFTHTMSDFATYSPRHWWPWPCFWK